MSEAARVLSPDELVAQLQAIGAERYHDKHPFQLRLQEGGCSKAQLQAWALNRYYYQSRIPLKDAIILSRIEDPALRREWRKRLVDHDGEGEDRGGIEKWLVLAEGLGLQRSEVVAATAILPGTRFAVDAYLALVRERSLLEAIASSLTELFSPNVIQTRVAGMLAHYDFVTPDILAYFAARPEQARRDVDVALAYLRRHATTAETQAAVSAALRTKCDILWAMLDALEHAYVTPGRVPPGAWLPPHLTLADPGARPRLARGVRLQQDPARGGHVLLAPERVVAANGSAVAILGLCDGSRGPAEIVDELVSRYGAHRARIAADVETLLADLAAKRLIEL